MSTGLVVGKFWPPHMGHHLLLDTLADRCERVVCVVCAPHGQVPSGGDRAVWLQSAHPLVEVVVVDDFCAWHHPEPCEVACSAKWAERVTRLSVGPIDVVATSESYGDRFAGLLGAEHLSVDPERVTVPISSTAIRDDLAAHWGYLHRATRHGLTRRVVVLGAESTGTSTLARDLAREIDVPLTAEVGRTVSWELFAQAGNDMSKVEWTEASFWRIVDRQIALEHWALDSVADRAPGPLGPWLVADTDTLATVAWWERYLGTDAGALSRFAGARLADAYLLTDPEGVDFDDSDPLRDGASIRHAMHARLRELVVAAGRPWTLVSGPPNARLAAAVEFVHNFERAHPRWVHH
jgi:HTH-type transcriptional repressor of NAD biosynthesis genes